MATSVGLYINGNWSAGAAGRTLPFWNPATRAVIGEVAVAERDDLDRALEGAAAGFRVWRRISAFERYKLLRKAADILRSRADD